MVLLDDDRLRYPNEYFTIKGKISSLKMNGGFADFLLTENGFTIECRGSTDLMKDIKEGQITEGNFVQEVCLFQCFSKKLRHIGCAKAQNIACVRLL